MKRLLITTYLLLLLPALVLAVPTDQEALKLVRGFYAPGYKSDQMPLSRRLAALLKAASKVGAPVEGLDFDWASNSQDAEQGWQKSARFSMEKSKPGQAAVRVHFRNNQRDNELVYRLVTESSHWTVDDIQSTIGDKWVLSQMLARGAKEKP